MTKEAFPYGRTRKGRREKEWTMKEYVESSLLYSTWSEVATVGDEVVGFLFGRIEKAWNERNWVSSLFSELVMIARFLVTSPMRIVGSLGLIWNLWITEIKLAQRRPKSDAEIELFIVDSKHRGRGIGKRLVDRFIEAAKKQGVETVTVYTEDLQSNYGFYEAYGFRRVATFYDDLTSYFANKASTAIIFALDLRQTRRGEGPQPSA